MAYCVKCGENIPGKYIDGQMQTCIHCSPTIAVNSAETVIWQPPPPPNSQETVIQRPAQTVEPKKKTSRAEIYAKGLISFLILSMMAITAAGLIIFGLIAIAANLKQNALEQANNEQITQPQQTKTQIDNPTIQRDSKTRIVGRFIIMGASASTPAQNVIVRVFAGNYKFEKKIVKKGWYIDDLPCNTSVEMTFGEAFQHSYSFFVPCQNIPMGIGAYDWNNGNYLSQDMDNIDGCFACN